MTTPQTPTDPNRRDVLASAARGLAALGAGALVGCGESGGTSGVAAPAVIRRRNLGDVLRVAVVGTGGRGHGHLKALGYIDPLWESLKKRPPPQERLADVEVVAVCDAYDVYLDSAVAAVTREGGPCGRYVDYRELLDREEVDAVVIATPDHLHVPVSLAAARAGCDVYVEKCMSMTVAEALEFETVAEQTGCVVQVGHQGRQDSLHELAREIVRRGDLGEVNQVIIPFSRGGPTAGWNQKIVAEGGPPRDEVHWEQFLGPAPARPYDVQRFFEWRRYWDYSTGIAGDLMSHQLDTVNHVLELPEPDAAVASGGVYHWLDERETPDTFSASFEYADRRLSVVYAATLSNGHGNRPIRFIGSEATMELNWEINVYPDRHSTLYAEDLAAGTKWPDVPFIQAGKADGALALTAAPSALWLAGQGLTTTTRDGKSYDTTRLHHEDFHAAMRTRGTPSAGLPTSFVTTVGCHMSTRAYREGRRVTWDRDNRRVV